MITFDHVSKQFQDGTEAVKNISFSIKKGEFFVLIGPSGCGKTTTLKMINRLIPLTKGYIRINDQPISDYNIHELRWNIGYVLQQIALFPHMTIDENIAIVPELKKWQREKIEQRISELLEMVGLDPDIYRKRKPMELSGGQQQRIGVIRALAADPDIILMDEPFSALDPLSREKLQKDIKALHRKINKTIVFVTHDIDEAFKLADRICLMNNGEIVQIGTPEEIVSQPANDFVRDFVGAKEPIHLPFNVYDHLQPFKEGKMLPTVSSEVTLGSLLNQLSQTEEVAVKEDNEMIGTINRQQMISYFSASLEKGSEKHV